MIDLLNQQLADALDLGLQAKQAHWNVKRPHFIGLHELFDKVAEDLQESIDNIAERAVQLGGIALGTIQVVSKNSRQSAYPWMYCLEMSMSPDWQSRLQNLRRQCAPPLVLPENPATPIQRTYSPRFPVV